MKVGFLTLGCKTNTYDTNAMASLFEKAGFEVVGEQEPADVFVINSCCVTNIAQRKSRQAVERVLKRNPHAVVAMTGCYAQKFSEEASALRNVHIVAGTRDRGEIVNLVTCYLQEHQNSIKVTDISKNRRFEELEGDVFEHKTRAYVKIQDGCDHFCSYCIIPYTRGRSASRSKGSILAECVKLAEKGFREIVLTGIHIDSYGLDNHSCTFVELIEAIHSATEPYGVRIRLGSLDPHFMDEEFVRRISGLERICPQFHLSLQSGSSSVLKRMNRGYTAEEYLDKVNLLKSAYENPAFTTDIIVGFPGETQEEFEQACTFVKQVSFAKIHLFPYSKREGTPAARMPNQVPKQIVSERLKQLRQIEAEMREAYMRKLLNKNVGVLLEETKAVPEGICTCGYSDEYVYVHVPACPERENTLCSVKVTKVCGTYVQGVLI